VRENDLLWNFAFYAAFFGPSITGSFDFILAYAFGWLTTSVESGHSQMFPYRQHGLDTA
jgi:hypothetical protein